MLAYACLVILVLIIVWITIYKLTTPTHFERPSRTHLHNTIDNSDFFQRLSQLDLKARNVTTVAEYIQKYKRHVYMCDSQQTKTLTDLVLQIKSKTQDYKNLRTVPFKIVVFEGIEENYPHTLGDIIFLPQAFFDKPHNDQIETLLHEQIHVYQRLYPIETQRLFDQLGFTIFATQKSVPRIRANPDIGNFVYKYQDTVQACVYNNDDPKSIKDARVIQFEGKNPWDFKLPQTEHPNEIMACAISKIILNQYHHEKIMLWMREFM